MSTAAQELVAHYNAAADPAHLENAITVGKLKALLDAHPDDAIVILAKDSEGNGFSPLAEVDACWYLPDSTWSGEVEQIGPYEDGTVYDPEPGDLYAVCLGPVN